MNTKWLKLALVGCLILIVLAIKLSVQHSSTKGNQDSSVLISSLDVSRISPEEVTIKDYNHLSEKEIEYLKYQYGNDVRFIEEGVAIYEDDGFGGRLKKIITSKWPQAEVSGRIPEPDFGKLEKIEYTDEWMQVFLGKISHTQYRKYLKLLRQEEYQNDEKKIETDIIERTILQNENGWQVTVNYYKNTRQMDILVEKSED